MKRPSLNEMTVADLVVRFEDIALKQDEAVLNWDTRRYNKLFREMETVDQELRARGVEARLALTDLHNHPNPEVRLQAAIYTLGVAPVEARRILDEIRDGELPYALDAGMIVSGLDNGSYVPD